MRTFAGKTLNVNVSASSQRIKIDSDPAVIRVFNDGTATAWIDFGGSGITTTTTTGVPIATKQAFEFQVANGDATAVYVAVIAAGATGRVYFTPGI